MGVGGGKTEKCPPPTPSNTGSGSGLILFASEFPPQKIHFMKSKINVFPFLQQPHPALQEAPDPGGDLKLLQPPGHGEPSGA